MLDFKEKIKSNFSESAKEYDKYAFLHQEIAKNLAAKIPNQKWGEIIDVGCGTGFLTFELARKFRAARIVGVDLAPRMILQAENKNKDPDLDKLVFRVGDGEQLLVADNSFDLVVSSSSFQWMDPQKCFAEAKRVLKTGSYFYFSLFGSRTLRELKEIMGREKFINYPATNQLKQILENSGFIKIELASEIKKLEFAGFFDLIRFIKGLGAQANFFSLGMKSRAVFREAEKCYNLKHKVNSGVYASFEVVYASMKGGADE